MDIYEYLDDVDRGLDFAMWLYRQQTAQEREHGTTLDANRRGFNTPDAKRLDQSLKALSKGIKFPRYDIIKWYRHDVEKRLVKYKKQFKVYMSSKQSTHEGHPIDTANHRDFERRHPMV